MGSVASGSDSSLVGCSGHETSFSPSIPPLPVWIHYFVSKLILVNFLYRPPSLLPSLSPFWIKQKTNKKIEINLFLPIPRVDYLSKKGIDWFLL